MSNLTLTSGVCMSWCQPGRSVPSSSEVSPGAGACWCLCPLPSPVAKLGPGPPLAPLSSPLRRTAWGSVGPRPEHCSPLPTALYLYGSADSQISSPTAGEHGRASTHRRWFRKLQVFPQVAKLNWHCFKFFKVCPALQIRNMFLQNLSKNSMWRRRLFIRFLFAICIVNYVGIWVQELRKEQKG